MVNPTKDAKAAGGSMTLQGGDGGRAGEAEEGGEGACAADTAGLVEGARENATVQICARPLQDDGLGAKMTP